MSLSAQDREDWNIAHKAMHAAVNKVYDSRNVSDFALNIESLQRLILETSEKKIRHGFKSGNGGLDVEIMSAVAGPIVSLLKTAAEPVTNKDIVLATGLPDQSVSLCTYYLRQIGAVSVSKKKGRSNAISLTGTQISKGGIEKAWTSIQLAPFVKDVIPDWFG